MIQYGMEELAQKRMYQTYLNALDGREVLDHYGAEHITEQPGENGTTELIHSCLIDRVEPHHKNGDANPSAALNVEKRKYICYASTWRGDLFHLVMKMEGKESFNEALLAVSDLIHAGPESTQDFSDRIVKMLSAPLAYSIAPVSYSDSILNGFCQWEIPHPYLTWRGITEEAVDRLRLGWDERENRIVFPHFFKGHLVGWQKRAIPGWDMSQVPPVHYPWPETEVQDPKYRSSSGFPKAETLYNYDFTAGMSTVTKMQTHVIVVESPFSVAKAYSLGFPNVLATFGAKVTQNQLALLRDFGSVTVWFDDDDAGRAGERKLVEGLPLSQVRVVTPDFNRDLADCNHREEVLAKLSSAAPAFLKAAGYKKARRTATCR